MRANACSNPPMGSTPGDKRALGVAAPEGAPRFIPLYRQIKDLIVRGLRDGAWKPGEPIPSEVELAARYGVSQGTVRKAIDELAAGNRLVRRQGRGTFVATHSESRTQYRFLRLRPDEVGADPSMARGLVECRRVRAGTDVARMLGLRAGENVLWLRRVLAFGARATVLDDIWLPAARFRGLTAERLSTYDGPLYALFEREFGTTMVRAEERLKAVAADDVAAALLELPAGAPLLQVERVSMTYADVPVEYRKGLYLTLRHHYFNEVS